MSMACRELCSQIMAVAHKIRKFHLHATTHVIGNTANFHSAQAPLLTLLEIRKFAPHLLDGKMQIFVDGGIRRGTDVLKALALGATAVGMARPFLFSLSAGYGEKGPRRVLEILRHEIESNMIFLGATNLSELRPEMLNTARLERDMIGSVKL